LTGWVQNNRCGVELEIQGHNFSQFIAALSESLPPLAQIDAFQIDSIAEIDNEIDFVIRPSQAGASQTLIAPDTCVCADCLNELFNPLSRYYRYPFLNCTQCGPRFTITRSLPYDRAHTSLAEFPLCEQCQSDYTDPMNRRYHAQPTACLHCGPMLSASIEQIKQALEVGEIIALKGLGGYQFICDANNQHAVLSLRVRKHRP